MTIVAAHWTEQRQCPHEHREPVRFQTAGGTEQIRVACTDCGIRLSQPERHASHPSRGAYPVLVDHPDPCTCHPANNVIPRAVESSAYAGYLQSPAWRARRTYYVAKALGRCQLCNQPGGPGGQGLEAHHRTYERLGSELDCDVIVLCARCHSRHHEHMPAREQAA